MGPIVDRQREMLGALLDCLFFFSCTSLRSSLMRWFHRCTPDILKGNVGKYFGTPLITYMDDDSPSGADIYLAASRLLLPLKRACASTMAHSGEENGFLLEANGETSSGCNGQCEPRDQSMGNTELEGTSSQELPFQLFLTDDRYLSCKPIFKDSVIKSGNRIKVVFEWTEKEQKLYDSSNLKDLPEVYHKTGYRAKKTRQEAVSLFSCLEAFLTEEPLGPDDMWYDCFLKTKFFSTFPVRYYFGYQAKAHHTIFMTMHFILMQVLS